MISFSQIKRFFTPLLIGVCILISCSEETIITLSLEGFSFKVENNNSLEKDTEGILSENADTVTIYIPHFTEVSSLVASFDIPDGATAYVNDVGQTSDVTQNNFSDELIYTISASQDDEFIFTVNCINDLFLSTISYASDSNRIGAGDFTKEDLFSLSNINNGTWEYEISIGEYLYSGQSEAIANSLVIPNFLSLEEWLAINNNEDGELTVSLTLSSEQYGVSNETFDFTLTKEQYAIKSWQDLQAMSYDLFGEYKIYNNIVFPYPGLDQFPLEGFIPVGDSLENSFMGSLDGQSYVIQNFYINRKSTEIRYVGLFGVIERRADILPIIKNLGIEISDREENGGVTGGMYAGGLAGWSEGKLINCYVTGDVTSYGSNEEPGGAGGLVGCNYGGEILQCYASQGKTESVVLAGGLVGENTQDGEISQCYSTQYVIVTGVDEYGNQTISAGGLVGTNSLTATIVNCYASGDVEGNQSIGGLVGIHSIENTIRTCYSLGNVIESDASGSEDVGGFIGLISGDDGEDEERRSITDSYWNMAANPGLDGVGSGDDYGVDGRSIREFQSDIMYVGWDFTYTWGISEGHNNGYAYLLEVNGQETE